MQVSVIVQLSSKKFVQLLLLLIVRLFGFTFGKNAHFIIVVLKAMGLCLLVSSSLWLLLCLHYVLKIVVLIALFAVSIKMHVLLQFQIFHLAMLVSFAVRMPSVFLPVSTVMVTETARMALMNRTVQLLLVQETSFCVPMEGQEESLDAFSVHHCVMARKTVRTQQMRKQLVVSIT